MSNVINIKQHSNKTRRKTMLYQQGDVLIETVDAIPQGMVETEKVNGRHILAEGEATGHAHACVDDNVTLYGEFGNLFVEAKEDFVVSHEVHHTISVPEGKYKFRQVKEYDHFEEEARTVRD